MKHIEHAFHINNSSNQVSSLRLIISKIPCLMMLKQNIWHKCFFDRSLSAFFWNPISVTFLLGEELSNKVESDPFWAPLWLLWLVLTHYLPTLPCFFCIWDGGFSLMQLFHWDPGRRVIVRAAPGVALSDCNSIISGLAMTIIPGLITRRQNCFTNSNVCMRIWDCGKGKTRWLWSFCQQSFLKKKAFCEHTASWLHEWCFCFLN